MKNPTGARPTVPHTGNAFFVANVVDAETGEPVRVFTALAGTSRMRDIGWQWQPHTVRAFDQGHMQWPAPGKRGYKTQVLRIEADGYTPYHTPMIQRLNPDESALPAGATTGPNGETIPNILYGRDGEPAAWTIRVQRDPGIKGQARLPHGQPAINAQVAVAMARREVRIAEGRILVPPLPEDAGLRDRWGQPIQTATDSEGWFRLPSEPGPAAVVITHPEGIATLSLDEFARNPEVTLEPWGAIDGQVLWNDIPGTNVNVHIGARTRVADQYHLVVGCSSSIVTDDQGRFRVERLPPGLAQVSQVIQVPGTEGGSFRPVQFVEIASGEITPFVFGGRGRPVEGRLAGFHHASDMRIRIAPNAPHPRLLANGQDATWAAYRQFLQSASGEHYAQGDIRVNADGTFRIDDVPPETYQLFVTAPRADGKMGNVGFAQFTINTLPGGTTDESFDVGEIRIATP